VQAGMAAMPRPPHPGPSSVSASTAVIRMVGAADAAGATGAAGPQCRAGRFLSAGGLARTPLAPMIRMWRPSCSPPRPYDAE
jgi:hypothetical protein